MTIKRPGDNALFLSCWYDRSRPVYVACLLAIFASLIGLSYLTVMLNPPLKTNAAQVFLMSVKSPRSLCSRCSAHFLFMGSVFGKNRPGRWIFTGIRRRACQTRSSVLCSAGRLSSGGCSAPYSWRRPCSRP